MFCSIIVPVYNPNQERFNLLLNSLVNQTNKTDFEVLFINDAGNVDFHQEVINILGNNVKFKLIDLEENIGQGMARQKGIEIAEGDWITFVDQDDNLSVTAIETAKKIIEDSKCTFLLSTKSIVANDTEWFNNGLYTADSSVSVLHGKWYNKKMLEKYNIHFTDKVRAHEDTFFQNLVYSYQVLIPELREYERSVVECDIITYFWYLWTDSQSHKQYDGPFGQLSYMESSMDQYITATIESYEEVKNSSYVPVLIDDFVYSKLSSFMYFIYFFMQSFEFINEIQWNKYNLLQVRRARDYVIKELKMDSPEELVKFLISMPSMYRFTYDEVMNNIQDAYIPLQTIKEFYMDLDNRIEEFKLI